MVLMCVLAASGQTALKPGDKAPAFTAVTHTGEPFQLDSAGTTILLFYRGYWCPYCNRQLSSLNDSLSFLEAKGAKVVAVTPEKYESVDKTIEKTKASFVIISDTSNNILEQYGVNFAVDEKTVTRYKAIGIDFSAVNANDENVLPVPAVYIIKNGKISYVWFDKDYRKRPSVKELLDNL
jgi:peroxiredoxin